MRSAPTLRSFYALVGRKVHRALRNAEVHRTAGAELYTHTPDERSGTLIRVRSALSRQRGAERTEVAQAHRAALRQEVNNHSLQGVETRLDVRARQRTRFLDALNHLLTQHGHRGRNLRVEL